MAQQKRFQDLNLADAYLFAAALEDAETCRLTLEILLGRKISHVTVHAEHTVLFSKDYHSIRLDVYAKDDECSDYNVEMQGENEGNLPKRSRYHQAQMDVTRIGIGRRHDQNLSEHQREKYRGCPERIGTFSGICGKQHGGMRRQAG